MYVALTAGNMVQEYYIAQAVLIALKYVIGRLQLRNFDHMYSFLIVS